MKRLGLFLIAVFGIACGGGGDKTVPDMSACGPVTCSAITSYNAKTCSCVPADLSMTSAPMDMTVIGDF